MPHGVGLAQANLREILKFRRVCADLTCASTEKSLTLKLSRGNRYLIFKSIAPTFIEQYKEALAWAGAVRFPKPVSKAFKKAYIASGMI